MTKEEQFLLNRLLDLARRAYMSGRPEYSDFLNLNEQDIFLANKSNLPPVNYLLFGGYNYAERKIFIFEPTDYYGSNDIPIVAIKCRPINLKFSDSLTHRDYLGALMNLGINRNVLGDILIDDNIAYIICLNSISSYILENLLKIKHTMVTTEKICLDELTNIKPLLTEITGFISSNRLDSVISVAYNISRGRATEYISQSKVFINSKLVNSNSYTLKEKDIVSVRGLGRFIFNNVITTTKKNRLMISLSKY
ncbi:MAG: RNA-binding protein [Lachnospiraceae bacterium]|nr:RNA-binding protein [Lachnospiraceae bacterium]